MLELAKQMWGAYAIQAGNKTFDGKPLPNWDELGEDRQSCWVAAAKVSADRIEQLEAALRPFAAAADTLDKEGWDNLHIEGSNADVTGEHCRVARAALEGKDEQ